MRLAVGAPRKKVQLQFLLEAVFLSGVGGLAGVATALAIGLLLTFVVQGFSAVAPRGRWRLASWRLSVSGSWLGTGRPGARRGSTRWKHCATSSGGYLRIGTRSLLRTPYPRGRIWARGSLLEVSSRTRPRSASRCRAARRRCSRTISRPNPPGRMPLLLAHLHVRDRVVRRLPDRGVRQVVDVEPGAGIGNAVHQHAAGAQARDAHLAVRDRACRPTRWRSSAARETRRRSTRAASGARSVSSCAITV